MSRAGTRVVLVVGGTSGIGRATARLLHERGDVVVVAAREASRVATVAEELGGQASGVACDVTDRADVDAAVAHCVRRHGRLDAVVLTAQVMAYGTTEEVPEEVFAHVVDVAVLGAFHVARAALPQFRAQGGGALVVVSSLLAEVAVPSLGAYCTGKWGQLGLVRSLQNEVRGEPGIAVSLVLPGAVDTPIYAQAATYAGRAGAAPPPVVTPERVARTCLAVLERPRRLVHVGPANWLTVIGFRLLPWLFDLLVGPLARHVTLRGPRVGPRPGNALEPQAGAEAERGGWNVLGLRRRRRRT